MDRRERHDDPIEATRMGLEGKQAEMWTSLPGIVVSFDAVAMTASVQPAIKGQITDEAGATSFVDLPLLEDVPVEFPSGGGFILTFPIRSGDECVLVFSSRCIDDWWALGDVQQPFEGRMHDLSDAICRVGPRSQTRVLDPPVDTEATQLRTDDAQAKISMYPDYTIRAENPAGKIEITPEGVVAAEGNTSIVLKAPLINLVGGAFTMQGMGNETPTATINADIVQRGKIESTGDHVAGGVSLTTHRHSGVESGGSNTGGPV